ncbi:hypothetical protein M407DRAFT_7820 [Tulasnella calospora MUT 4182]|uniref:Uncharacterized protein n=1 Tax=Tulasnella calospora MUT 4182 TaxID=1051891 RepID=A0A0C3LYA6_9AGAM|nr:hypothetical protein M407DRAFT_7820 [Tulasnella calospora MUT 4182]
MGQIEHGVDGELQLLGDSSSESGSTDSDASSAGSDSDSEMVDADQQVREEMLQAAILESEQRNIHNAAREPDDDPNPFDGNPGAEKLFWNFLDHQIQEIHIPDGYPFLPWDEIDILKVGKRDVEIRLPEKVWAPRAIRWAQGLESMVHCMELIDSLSD